VQLPVSMHSEASANSRVIGALNPQDTFTPVARSGFSNFEWVLVSDPSSGRSLGWVYAGTDLGLVSCTHLELVQ
jgi:hypothetical protein